VPTRDRRAVVTVDDHALALLTWGRRRGVLVPELRHREL
jgi:hypothetical protein